MRVCKAQENKRVLENGLVIIAMVGGRGLGPNNKQRTELQTTKGKT